MNLLAAGGGLLGVDLALRGGVNVLVGTAGGALGDQGRLFDVFLVYGVYDRGLLGEGVVHGLLARLLSFLAVYNILLLILIP